MNSNLEKIKILREKTGAGFSDCKNALLNSNGSLEDSITILKNKSILSADKKILREVTQGIISSYIHTNLKLGVLLELNCETDFVAKREEFKTLGKNLAMQVASNAEIIYVSLSDIPEEIFNIEKNKLSEENNYENIKNLLKKNTLLDQQYFKDTTISVEELIKTHITLLGENIKVSKFIRYQIN